jgi:hypothetical protein
MDSPYDQQRTWLVEHWPDGAALLPPVPPARPDIAALGEEQLARLLEEPAGNQASMLCVVGWGDGSVIRAILGDPALAWKDLLVLLLKGEEAAFAASFTTPLVEAMQRSRVSISRIFDASSLRDFANTSFGTHGAIPRLAGADFVDAHPLSAEGEAFRREYLPGIYQALTDRPQSYGNDVVDSFLGLTHASYNSATLLPAPPIEALAGFFGEVPIISIAAGPSLARHIDRLRELQDRCILVACDAVLHGLLDAGIQPHFVTPLERVGESPMVVRAPGTRCIYAGLPVCQPDTVNAFEGRAIGLYCGDELYRWLWPEVGRRINTGSSTGVLSFNLSVLLGTGPVWLVGHDLSRGSAASHWQGATYASSEWKKFKGSSESEQVAMSGFEERLIPGNDGGLVTSMTWWDRFRQELECDIGKLTGAGRRICNVNAYDRTGAVIDGTLPEPLPDPASLPQLPPLALPARDEGRLHQWQKRAKLLPQDADAFLRHLATMRDEFAAVRRQPPDAWPVEKLAERLSLTAPVSEGNRGAFAYFLRSAMHNVTAEMHARRRTASPASCRWRIMDSMDSLSHALTNAVTTLRPVLQEIADDYC